MINNIEFKNHEGYLQATIDNQTLPLTLEEIVKDKVNITNIASTGIPLYTDIPIHLKITTEKNNTIESGLIRIRILDSDIENPQVLYEENGYIIQNIYQTNINHFLELGTYIVEVYYYGDKFFESSQLSYYLTVEKRPLFFKMDKDSYHGKPYEDVTVQLELYDFLNKNPIINTRIDYIYGKIHYITKTNNEGKINFDISIPDDCTGSNILIYIENEIYEYTSVRIPVITDRLETEIHNTYSFEENNLFLNGNVFAYNKDTMYNAKYGNIELYIEDELVDEGEVEEGIFQLGYNYYKLLSGYSSSNNTIINEKDNINTKISINTKIVDSIPGEVEFVVTVTDYNDIKITDGIVYFQLDNNANHYITELDENGQAFCYFYLSKSGKHKIKYRYFGIFEYENSEIKEESIEV